MGRINILQPKVFNMLAAGEVVENPASVVKELVENSLDAGATEIDITVEQGGIRKIQVSDNGIGILKEDLRTAFVPHATSKINDINDLDSLSTLGFRGEALASIASVSEITMASASKAQGNASKITLSGGIVTGESPDSRNQGTIITVENLFFNTPARLKFLKKPANELRQIVDIVRILVLSNPEVSFTLNNEEGEILHHESGSLADAICAVYGAKTVDKLLEIKDNYDGTIKVNGFISSCDFTKPNRTYQTVIINGRAVTDITIQTAVEKAYGDYLMKRAYPMFVLDVLMPFDEVDVNVHPRKSEVRFYDKQKIFGAVYHAVQDTINASIGKSTVGFDLSKQTNSSLSISTESDTANLSKDITRQEPQIENTSIEQAKIDTTFLFSGKNAPYQNSVPVKKLSGFSEPRGVMDFSFPQTYKQAPGTTSSASNFKLTEQSEQDKSEVFDGKILGQLFATYLLVERDEKLYIIDQHAAHERILYDKLVDNCTSHYSQTLLSPYKLSLSSTEEDYIEKILPTLSAMGFEINRNGYTYEVKAVPELVAQMNLSEFFSELFSNTLDENELTLAGLLKEKLCQQACKAAIKGGEVLSREQIQQVIKNYVSDEGTLPSKCPHGRPAVVVLDKREFEKMFKRII